MDPPSRLAAATGGTIDLPIGIAGIACGELDMDGTEFGEAAEAISFVRRLNVYVETGGT
jgi:hypothetical protein